MTAAAAAIATNPELAAPIVSSLNDNSEAHKERRLAIGDFARFNQLFQNARIAVPGKSKVSERVGIATLNMNLRNIESYDISIGDVNVTHVRNSAQEIDVQVKVIQLDMTCDLSYNPTTMDS